MLSDFGFCIYPTILMILGCFGAKRCSKFMSCGCCSKKVKIDLIYYTHNYIVIVSLYKQHT